MPVALGWKGLSLNVSAVDLADDPAPGAAWQIAGSSARAQTWLDQVVARMQGHRASRSRVALSLSGMLSRLSQLSQYGKHDQIDPEPSNIVHLTCFRPSHNHSAFDFSNGIFV